MKNISKLKKIYIAYFELKNYYISYKLFKIKKVTYVKNEPVKFLKTSRYVIPLPSEDESYKSKPKLWILFNSNLQLLYDLYNNYMTEQNGFFYSSWYSIYNPDKTPNINKFDYQIKFDVIRILKNTFKLTVETSFYSSFTKIYFSSKNFKLLSLLYFWDMFKKYWNPNLPLLRKKGENFTPKVEGTKLLKIKEFIYWQLVFEDLGWTYTFNINELKIFKLASINPDDPRYYWPTRRLFLLDLSIHDGWIVPSNQANSFWSFSEIPSFEIKNNILFPLKRKILLQFLYWRSMLLKLASEKKLLYHLPSQVPFKINLYNIINPNHTFVNFFYKYFFVLQDYIHSRLHIDEKFSFVTFPIPTHYLGTPDLLFQTNYFYLHNNNQKEQNAINSKLLERFDIYTFLNKFKLFTGDNCNPDYYIFKDNVNFFYDNPTKHQTTFEFYKNFTPVEAVDYMSNSSNFIENNQKLSSAVTALPDFIKIFFFMLFQLQILPEDINVVCIEPFLHLLPDYKIAKKMAIKNVDNFLGDLQVYKQYFTHAIKYDLHDPTLAYKALKKVLLTMPNKDFSIYKLEPFGLNPFYKFTQTLTKKDVPFPAAVSNYTFYQVLRKETTPSIELNYKFKSIFILNFQKYFTLIFFKNPLLFTNYLFSFFHKSFYANFDFIHLKSFFVFLKKKRKKINYFLRFCLKFKVTLPLLFKISKRNTALRSLEEKYLDMQLSVIENTDTMDFLKINQNPLLTYSETEAEYLFNKWVKKFTTSVFLKNFEKQRSFAFINTMFKLLWLIKFFHRNLSAQALTFTIKFLHFTYYYYSSQNQPFNFYIYEFNFLHFVRIFYFTKFFTKFFISNFKIQLKNK